MRVVEGGRRAREEGYPEAADGPPSGKAASGVFDRPPRGGHSNEMRGAPRVKRTASREKVQHTLEAVGGCRVGEVSGAGQGHGVLANDIAILRDLDTGFTTVEMKLEHSKTGFSRYMNIAADTKGVAGVQCSRIIEQHWKEWGFTLTTYTQAGVQVIRPDFWVVRVSLLGIENLNALRPLFAILRKSKCRSARDQSDHSELRGRERLIANGVGSQAKKFINVAAGTRADATMNDLLAEIVRAGFDAVITQGPLLMATTGGTGQKPTIMPLATGTAQKPMKELLESACQRANSNPDDPDPDLDLIPGEKPKWTSHSERRGSDTVARRDREKTGSTEAEIDIYYGWHEKVLLKEMQVHYAAMSIKERMKQAKITSLM